MGPKSRSEVLLGYAGRLRGDRSSVRSSTLQMPNIPLSRCERDVAGRAGWDEHARRGFEQEKHSNLTITRRSPPAIFAWLAG